MFIQREDLCFDIGANIGDKTKIFLKLGGRVVCIEPLKSCIRHLFNHYRNNKYTRIVRKAVGFKEGIAELFICDEYNTLSTLSEKWRTESEYAIKHKWSKTESVSITTLDNLIITYGLPKFCKIDVEGYEWEVIRGLSQKIPYIAFEFHKSFFNELKKCIAYLMTLGNPKFNLTKGEGTKLFFPTWISSDELLQTLTLIKNDFLWGDIIIKFI